MANFDGGLASGYILRLIVDQGGQNVSGNFTDCPWRLEIVKGSGSGKWADGPHYWSVNINGSVYSGSIGSYDFTAYTVLQLGVGTTRVYHNADGTKTIGVSAGYNDNDTWGELGDGSSGGSLGLTTIPRATTGVWAVPGNAIAGVNKTLNLPRASASFTHTVQYAFGSSGWVTVGTGLGTSVVMNFPLALLSNIPNNITGTGTIRVTTYNGGTWIGARDSAFTLEAPASVVPDFTTVTHSEATAGVAANVGAYVQGVSKLDLAITGAAGIYGSTISSYKIEVGGQVVNTQSGATPAPINGSGTVPIVATVTDSRGRTKSKTINITVLTYGPPTITAIGGERALGDGSQNDEGSFIRVNVNAAVQSLINSTQRNSLNIRVSSRLRGTVPWTVKSNTTPSGVSFNGYVLVSGYSIEDAYDFLVEVYDDFSTSAQQFTIPTAAIFMHWDGRDGVGVGKYRTNGMLDILGQGYQNDGQMILDEAMLEERYTTGILDPLYFGPGPAKVLLDGVLTASALEWLVPYVPNGSRVVNVQLIGGSLFITGQSADTSKGGMYRLALQNNWRAYNGVQYTNNFREPGFATRLPSGIVMLGGLIAGGTLTSNTLIAVLPPHMWPDYDMMFGVNQSDTPRAIRILANGEIRTQSGWGPAGGYVSLDGIAFPAAGVADWTSVGAVGSGSAFANGWVDGGVAAHGPARFWKDSFGFVWLGGTVKSGSTAADNTNMFTLPATHRVDLEHHIATTSQDNFGILGAQPDDGVNWKQGTAGNGSVYLDGATLLTADSNALNWKSAVLINSWIRHGSGFPPPAYLLREDGLAISRGLIAGGTLDARAYQMEEEFRPKRQFLMQTVTNSVRGRIDIYPTGAYNITQGSNTWFSMDSIKWYPGA